MKHLALAIMGCLACARMTAQTQQPIFKQKADSVEYYSLFQKITRLYDAMGRSTEKQRDSLGTAVKYWVDRQERLRDKIVGFKWVYTPSHPLLKDALEETRDSVTAITLQNVSSLPPELFQFKNLMKLELIDCRLPKLPRKLAQLKRLQQIAIYTDRSGRRIRLATNKTVKTLVIASNRLPKNYRPFKALHRLDLSRNNLTDFPNIKGCKKLKELSLRDNQLTLEYLRSRSATLEVLELQKNKITAVPPTIAQFPNLKRLVFNYNPIETVSDQLAKLTHLEQLGFYSNQLKQVPEAVYNLTALRELDLYYNQIERLDSRAGNWKKLEVLYLSNNKLISLPDNLGQLTSLRELYVHNNRLSSLPDSLSTLTNLKILRVNSNFLPTLPNIEVLDKLENIDLANNQLHTFPLGVFKFPKLKIISLLGNQWDDATKQEIKKQSAELEKKEVTVIFN
ncbi:MAG: leucine-rich repeat domain-containing protein [Flammeovirgaceae bacterium]